MTRILRIYYGPSMLTPVSINPASSSPPLSTIAVLLLPHQTWHFHLLNIKKCVYSKWVYSNWHFQQKTRFLAIFDNHLKLYSFDRFRPRGNDRDHGACLPVNVVSYLIQIRWIWTHLKGLLICLVLLKTKNCDLNSKLAIPIYYIPIHWCSNPEHQQIGKW
jgi:hypothetical protein